MSAITPAAHFLVRRDNLRQCGVVGDDLVATPELQPGQVLLRIAKFAFTANNITYAAFGEAMAYWAFFPAPAGWGRIPVWGFAEVERSRHEGIAEGERVFGYLPMSTHLVVQPDKLGIVRFMDASAQRLKLPAAYQSYTRVSGDTYYRAGFENHHCIFRPLFVTSYLIEDFLAENHLFGARRVVLSSASSKTALGLAHRLARHKPAGVEIVGLSSAGNLAFCKSTGYYDRVLTYDALTEMTANTPTAFVDMAGNGKLLHDLHHHFCEQLKYSCMVGGTHWEQRQTQHNLPGAQPAFFSHPRSCRSAARNGATARSNHASPKPCRNSLQLLSPGSRSSTARAARRLKRFIARCLRDRRHPSRGTCWRCEALCALPPSTNFPEQENDTQGLRCCTRRFGAAAGMQPRRATAEPRRVAAAGLRC